MSLMKNTALSSATRRCCWSAPPGGLVGGIVEIAPLFYLENTIEKVEGMRPTPRWSWPVATSTSARAAMSATAR
jgi:hypothetical protein